jgi:hypothetical protein
MIRNPILLVSLLATALTLFGQNTPGTGSISGLVTDAAGAAVPNANMIVENPSNGVRRELTTREGGVFNAPPSLTPAVGYRVTISAKGFATYQVNEIPLTVGQIVTLAPKLEVSSASTRVDVSAETALVDTSKSDVSELVGSRQIVELPYQRPKG